ncbi:Maf family protein [Curtanaerobium respiraculi]|uniref:Maf family protein n=1 Tax=Curtanaerobium respiraculi TaxID=2949669 RepID=UPI0024B3BDB6|nr:Maf family protein [Curtanaerobium respiraculi]
MDIILASSSPRRRDLLQRAGVKFAVRTAEAPVDESLDDELRADPVRAAREVAKRKAGAVVQELLAAEPDQRATEVAVIGADTMVVLEGRIFGKPHSYSEGVGMLRKLSGETHQVVTGVAVYVLQTAEDGNVTVGKGAFSETSDVTFKPLTEEQIASYLRMGESYDKAGAYAIQGAGMQLVAGYEGDYDNIVGLPVSTLLDAFPALRPE